MNYIHNFCHLRNLSVTTLSGRKPVNYRTFEEHSDHLYQTENLNYPKFHKMDSSCKLGLLACEILKRETSLNDYPGESVSVILSNAQGSLHTDLRFQQTIEAGASPSLFVYTLPNIVIGELCIRHHWKGENAFFVTPAFDPSLLTGYVDALLQQENNKACVAGWVELTEKEFDVFLYLVTKDNNAGAVSHSPEELSKLYYI